MYLDIQNFTESPGINRIRPLAKELATASRSVRLIRATSHKQQAPSHKLLEPSWKQTVHPIRTQTLKLQATSFKPQAASIKLQAASDKLPDSMSFIKFQAASVMGLDYDKTVDRMFHVKRNLVW